MNLTTQLGSYPYRQYNDDPNIGAFFQAYNDLSQQNLDDINAYQLPLYQRQSGALLDWAATSIYGVPRPSLSSGGPRPVGPLNSAALNTEPMNAFAEVNDSVSYVTTDTIYQRIIQWNTFKGDGYQFTTRWLKRRVQRFLTGDLFPDQTYQVSVHFIGSEAVITINSSVRFLVSGDFYNTQDLNADEMSINQSNTEAVVYTTTVLAEALRASIISGVLLLPFQYSYVVNIA